MAKSGRVALLTPTSVACAESTTATSRVKAFTCSSSPLGSGLAFWKRVKISCTVGASTTRRTRLDFFAAGAFLAAGAFFLGALFLRAAALFKTDMQAL